MLKQPKMECFVYFDSVWIFWTKKTHKCPTVLLTLKKNNQISYKVNFQDFDMRQVRLEMDYLLCCQHFTRKYCIHLNIFFIHLNSWLHKPWMMKYRLEKITTIIQGVSLDPWQTSGYLSLGQDKTKKSY